uniref:Uncharacterized protein n=1 Tax=Arundo donax TaxID=35708 RepID=A0A0A9GJQ0_ARUDO
MKYKMMTFTSSPRVYCSEVISVTCTVKHTHNTKFTFILKNISKR